MPFPRSERPFKASRESGPVLAIGRQAFINGSGGSDARVSLVDEKGAAVLSSLIDGAEVEIVAWEPRGHATRYFVRSTRDEITGWLGAAQLRTTRESISNTATATSPATVWVPPRLPGELRSEAGKRRKKPSDKRR